ncbi:hypothetical protein BRADI_3g46905v3 [Brachypodium distachyon]|uniref:Reverse transcriptase zinc-binding domain-containing protein n=1 Tax=Brachypodium distachyon TaxID=15368 RepID=A0A0Q3FPC9_BRADI|nr:hypothetical protein BRADI_3g46905v3 [Brachypodium distachyon]
METARHLVLECPFSTEIWASFMTERPRMCRAAEQSTSLSGWWNRLLKINSRKKNHDIVWASMVVWHLWKERNKRTFKDCRSLPHSVCPFIRSECGLLMEECKLQVLAG